MNLSPRWVDFLSTAGFEVVHWSAIGAANATDYAIMAHAKAHASVVLTQDLDFSSILAVTNGQKPSVVQIRSEDISVEAIGFNVIIALKQMKAELEAGALLTVDPKRIRLRVLPLRIDRFH